MRVESARAHGLASRNVGRADLADHAELHAGDDALLADDEAEGRAAVAVELGHLAALVDEDAVVADVDDVTLFHPGGAVARLFGGDLDAVLGRPFQLRSLLLLRCRPVKRRQNTDEKTDPDQRREHIIIRRLPRRSCPPVPRWCHRTHGAKATQQR